MSILIKNGELNGEITDLLIKGNIINKISKDIDEVADTTIDAKNMAIIPGFVNTHTHSAMTLFRGFGDDMPLMEWLTKRIWPNEAKMTADDVYWGTKLACLEMIKTGTTTFFDMYSMITASAQAVEESGIRGVLSYTFFDQFTDRRAKIDRDNAFILQKEFENYSDRVSFSLGPHAIYTVSGKQLKWAHDFTVEHSLPYHLHLSETKGEIEECIKNNGTTPVRYLKELGILSPNVILAHAIWVDDEEIKILADHGVNVAHNPASNMKLASGYQFKFDEMKEAGINVGIGTDGCASSNNLDMIEAMRLASFLGKAWRHNPVAVKAEDVLRSATENGADMLGINAGVIAEGRLADISLINLKNTAFTPNFNFISNLVYAANGSDVDTVICNGEILMQNRKVEGEEEILDKSCKIAYDLVKRKSV